MSKPRGRIRCSWLPVAAQVRATLPQFCGISGSTSTISVSYTHLLINIVLDPILIFGWFGLPRMEVAGAAIATVAGQIVAAAAALVLNLKCNPDIHILPREIRWHGKVAAEIYRVGFPSIVMQSIGSAMVFGMNKILFGRCV